MARPLNYEIDVLDGRVVALFYFDQGERRLRVAVGQWDDDEAERLVHQLADAIRRIRRCRLAASSAKRK